MNAVIDRLYFGRDEAKAKDVVRRYVIAVQLAKYLVAHSRDQHRETPAPVDALRSFLAANGETPDFRLHEKLWRVIKRLKSSLALETFGAKIALELGGPSEGIEAINRPEIIEEGVAGAITAIDCPAGHGALLLIDQIGARVKPSDTTFMIHPCFRTALRATSPDSAMELEPEYLRRRALRRNLAVTNVFGGIDTKIGRGDRAS
jgi:hypothetical protein